MATPAKELLEKYKLGTCSTQEKLLVEDWFMKYGTDENIIVSLQDVERIKGDMWQVVQANRNRGRKLWPRIFRRFRSEFGSKQFGTPLITTAAAAVALIILGVYFFSASRHPEAAQDPALASHDIAPGKNGATITLASGKVIQLSDVKTGVVIGEDKLAYNDGSSILSSRANAKDLIDSSKLGMTNLKEIALTAKTAKGQTYIFTLPDGTKVWLNAASTLTIPSDFSGTASRKVELTGEAYFEIAKVTRLSATGKDRRRERVPFVVKSAGQEIEVFGTHFNVNSYQDESITRTTLLEGSVRVTPFSAMGKEKSVLLKPGQESALSQKGELKVLTADTELALAWKNNKFMFENEDIRTIMRMVERWYNVDVVFDGEIPENKFLGSVSRFDHISKVLKTLELTEKVHFKLEGRRLIVTK